MQEDILGDYIKEIHKIRDEMLETLATIKDIYEKIIINKEKGELISADLAVTQLELTGAKVDLEKAKKDIEDLQKPVITP